MMRLGGVLVALATPFGADGSSVDEPALRRLVDAVIGGGVAGIVPCGSTGEFTSLTNEERRRVAEVVLDQAAGRVPVVPHVGAMTTHEAAGLARHAEAAGAAGVMAVAPWYEPLTLDETHAYFTGIAGSISIPVMAYNLPVATGNNLTGEWLAALAEETGNVCYVKDTSGDLAQAQRLAKDFGHLLGVFVGWDTLLAPAFIAGVAGTVVGAANFLAPQIVEVWQLVQSGRPDEALERWAHILPVLETLTSGHYNGGIKLGLEMIGLASGPNRDPVLPVPRAYRDLLAARIAELGLPQASVR